MDRQPDPWTPGMHIRKDDYYRFINYNQECREELAVFMVTREFIASTGSRWTWYSARCGACSLTPNGNVLPSKALGVGKHPTTWWATYWGRTITCVGDAPCEEVLEDDHIWKPIMRALAGECPTCHETATSEFPFFREKLLEMVTNIVNNVCIFFVD